MGAIVSLLLSIIGFFRGSPAPETLSPTTLPPSIPPLTNATLPSRPTLLPSKLPSRPPPTTTTLPPPPPAPPNPPPPSPAPVSAVTVGPVRPTPYGGISQAACGIPLVGVNKCNLLCDFFIRPDMWITSSEEVSGGETLAQCQCLKGGSLTGKPLEIFLPSVMSYNQCSVEILTFNVSPNLLGDVALRLVPFERDCTFAVTCDALDAALVCTSFWPTAWALPRNQDTVSLGRGTICSNGAGTFLTKLLEGDGSIDAVDGTNVRTRAPVDVYWNDLPWTFASGGGGYTLAEAYARLRTKGEVRWMSNADEGSGCIYDNYFFCDEYNPAAVQLQLRSEDENTEEDQTRLSEIQAERPDKLGASSGEDLVLTLEDNGGVF